MSRRALVPHAVTGLFAFLISTIVIRTGNKKAIRSSFPSKRVRVELGHFKTKLSDVPGRLVEDISIFSPSVKVEIGSSILHRHKLFWFNSTNPIAPSLCLWSKNNNVLCRISSVGIAKVTRQPGFRDERIDMDRHISSRSRTAIFQRDREVPFNNIAFIGRDYPLNIDSSREVYEGALD